VDGYMVAGKPASLRSSAGHVSLSPAPKSELPTGHR